MVENLEITKNDKNTAKRFMSWNPNVRTNK